MRRLLTTACLAGLLLPIAAATPALAEKPLPGGANSVQETFDAWTVSCAHQNNAKRCALAQQQVDQHSRERVLAIELSVAPGDKLRGTLILPFGLALEKAIKLQIDDAPPASTLRVRTCVPIGCLVNLSFDSHFVAALRKGTSLKVNAVADGGKEADFAISLKGFPAALDRMTELTK